MYYDDLWNPYKVCHKGTKAHLRFNKLKRNTRNRIAKLSRRKNRR